MKNKIINLENYFKLKKKLKSKKIIMAHGVFDYLHIGHLRYFNQCKKHADILIVSVTSDKYVNKGFNKPYFNDKLRMEAIASNIDVDYVVLSNSLTAERNIEKIKPDYYAKGNDYKSLINNDANFKKEILSLKKNKGKFLILKDIQHSSSKIINSSFLNYTNEQSKIIQKIKKKNLNLEKEFKNIKSKRILLIGETILDEFTYVKSLGKSRKNNLISTRYMKNEIQHGGALFILKNLNEYFNNIDYLSFCTQENYKFIKKIHKKVVPIFCKDDQIVKKKRFVDFYNLNKIFQLNTNDQLEINENNYISAKNKINKIKKKYDAIVICDFGHGLINGDFLKFLNKLKIKKFINCQANSSNFGFNRFYKFKEAELLSSDEDEFRLTTNDDKNNIKKIHANNRQYLKKYKNLIITAGKNGSYYFNKNSKFFVESFEVNNFIDSIGSGDVYFSYLISLFFSKKFDMKDKMLISHLASSLHSQSFANSKLIKKDKFLKYFNNLLM